MMIAHVQETPVAPSQRTDNAIPPDLEAVILECLAKDPAKRPQTARELAARLRTIHAGPAWTAERAEEWWRTHLPEGAIPRVEETR
jgi:hypothetical protein